MSLTNNDAKTILGMVARGDKRHDIAAYFGVNQARIAEVEEGHYGNLQAAAQGTLPPKGAPGPKGRKLSAFVEKAIRELESGNPKGAEKTLQDGLQRYNKPE